MSDVAETPVGSNTACEIKEVFATIVLDKSPRNKVFKDHLDLISQIIDSKEHLQRNIENFNFGIFLHGNLLIISLSTRFKYF